MMGKATVRDRLLIVSQTIWIFLELNEDTGITTF